MKKVAASVTPAALASANPRSSAITFMATGDCAGSFFLELPKMQKEIGLLGQRIFSMIVCDACCG